MTTLSAAALFTVETLDRLYERGLAVARAAGLPVTSWAVDDPARAFFKYLAVALNSRESVLADVIKGGLLETAEGDWLRLLAREVYGVDFESGTVAAGTVTLANTGGGVYSVAANELTFRATVNGLTYRNSEAFTLQSVGNSGATASVAFVADEEGSEYSLAVNELDELVTTLLGVDITSSTAAVGRDSEADVDLKERCYASTGALSPNGPGDAYEFVALNSKLTGTTEPVRARAYGDTANGTASVSITGATSDVSATSLAQVQSALNQWAKPLGFTPTAVNAPETSIDVSFTLTGSGLPADAVTQAQAVTTEYLATIGLGGLWSRSTLLGRLHAKLPALETVTGLLPAADVTLAEGAVVRASFIAVTVA